jgi:hypothetical protein
MGNSQARNTDTIGWANLNTENFSATGPNDILSNEARQLLNNIENASANNKYISKNNNELEDLSETSPFISSQMYNNMIGGAVKEDSSTSYTSSTGHKSKNVKSSSLDSNETLAKLDNLPETTNDNDDSSSTTSLSSTTESDHDDSDKTTENGEASYVSSESLTAQERRSRKMNVKSNKNAKQNNVVKTKRNKMLKKAEYDSSSSSLSSSSESELLDDDEELSSSSSHFNSEKSKKSKGAKKLVKQIKKSKHNKSSKKSSHKSKSDLSVTNENNNSPISSINTSDINMYTAS